MAWLSDGKDNSDLVMHLKSNGLIKTDRVEQAMLQVDRGKYSKNNAYMDSPQPIGYGATISAPHIHAESLELLKDQLKPGMRALDVGSGSGYLTVCMAIMVGETGKVVGIDHMEELVNLANDNVKLDQPHLLESERVKFVIGDGRKGYTSDGPYNAIYVGAAAPTLPQDLVDQLSPGGRMIIPIGPDGGGQNLYQIDKDLDGTVTREKLIGVGFIPLTDKDKQWQAPVTVSEPTTVPAPTIVPAPITVSVPTTVPALSNNDVKGTSGRVYKKGGHEIKQARTIKLMNAIIVPTTVPASTTVSEPITVPAPTTVPLPIGVSVPTTVDALSNDDSKKGGHETKKAGATKLKNAIFVTIFTTIFVTIFY